MKLFRHIILILTTLTLASCAVDEFWGGPDHTEGKEVVMTFKPTFEDFEAATKAIGDGYKVNTLLVHVYEGSSDTPYEYTYNIKDAKVQSKVSIPFFYGKEYKVYFFAYKSGEETAYKIAGNGLKGGVTVTYPTESLGFDALEALDAFYAVKDVNLSANVETSVSLARPFAQVNLVADKPQLLAAKATKVEFAVSAATSYDFVNGAVGESSPLTFSFEAKDYFQNNDPISEGTVYLGTTYLFVPSVEYLLATVTLYDVNGNELKEPSEVKIPLVSNNRTNLVFSGIEPAGPSWDVNEVKVPGADSDGWIHITRPEQLAAFLLNTTADGAKVCIDNDIDMSEIPGEVATNLAKASKSVKSLTLNGNNKTISGLSLSAFFNEATNLTAYDLTLSGITVTGTSHVGVLVNTLKGESSFSKVSILKSTATTTNGAAGGMVGYIVRKSATDRSESLPISFKDCHIIGTSATGKESAGKFVGKFSGYDNGETLTFTGCSTSEASASADNASPYVEGNEGAWLAGTDFSKFNLWLGDEAYYRGVVTFGDVRFQPKWDGKKTIEPLLANATYDAGTTAGSNRYVVYSAFDLAGLRKKTPSPAALYLMTNVDMFGQGKDGNYNIHSNFTQSKKESTDDNVFSPFNSITLLEGKNYGIYNLSMTTVGTTSYQAAFIIDGGNSHIHQNIKFYNCCTVVPHVVSNGEDKSYGSTFIISASGSGYKMDNIHIYDSKVFAIQKVGVLAGRVQSTGGATISNCSVNGCYVENYECKDNLERFTDSSGTVSADFYSYGEVGGLIGFVMYTATITGCSVSNTTIHAWGQDDQKAKLSGISLPVYIQGRNVNQFIGDIRCLSSQTITISNCEVSNNTCSQRNDIYNKGNKYPIIGKAYYVGGKFIKEFGEKKGTLYVQNITDNGNKLFTSKTNVTLQALI